jgi:hypothetical protein
MAFDLPDLPYAHDALAAHGMSQETLEYHHDIHHKAYVDNGNKLIAGTEWEGKSVEEIVIGTYQAGAVAQNGIFNNASQHWNHTQFWKMMAPGGTGIPGELEARINEAFGSLDAFKEAFAAAGAGQFGSGWAGWWQGYRWQPEGDQDRKRREPALLGSDRASGLRCVGAFLLHRLPQQAAGLSAELPRQSGQLGRCRCPFGGGLIPGRNEYGSLRQPHLPARRAARRTTSPAPPRRRR